MGGKSKQVKKKARKKTKTAAKNGKDKEQLPPKEVESGSSDEHSSDPKEEPNTPGSKDKEQLPPKEVESSTSDEHSSDPKQEPNTRASSSQANTFIVPKLNTLIVGNLSSTVDEDELRNFFQVAGEIVEIHLDTFEDKTCRGSAQVEFATVEALHKACTLSGSELMGRAVTVNFGHERRTINPDTSSLKKPDYFSANTVLISGFDPAYDSRKTSTSFKELFSSFGLIVKIETLMDVETGASIGVMFVQFEDPFSARNALRLNGHDLGGGFTLHVEKAQPRDQPRDHNIGFGDERVPSDLKKSIMQARMDKKLTHA